jgi:hypothetical protein
MSKPGIGTTLLAFLALIEISILAYLLFRIAIWLHS